MFQKLNRFITVIVMMLVILMTGANVGATTLSGMSDDVSYSSMSDMSSKHHAMSSDSSSCQDVACDCHHMSHHSGCEHVTGQCGCSASLCGHVVGTILMFPFSIEKHQLSHFYSALTSLKLQGHVNSLYRPPIA